MPIFAGETKKIQSIIEIYEPEEMRDCLCCSLVIQDDSSIDSPRLYPNDITPSSSCQSLRPIIESCFVAGKLDLRLLRTHQPQLYSEFHRYLSVRYSEENLDCWLVLNHILEASDKETALTLLMSAFEIYFVDGSNSQVSCIEIYSSIQHLRYEADNLSLKRIQCTIAQIQHVLECSALQLSLSDWLREVLHSQVTNFGLFESSSRGPD